MNKQTGVIRFEPNGPNGLSRIELDPADFHKMPETQNIHVYFEDAELGLSVGVWDTTTMQEAFGPYPGDEFILVLDGAFEMLDGQGGGVPAKQGQSVIFRNGVPVSWKQDGYLKKYYITYKDPRAATPEIDSAEGGIIALCPDRHLEDVAPVEGFSPRQREQILFTNDHQNFEVGLWDTQEWTTDLAPFPWHEFCQILEGQVIITEEDGTSHHFSTGDVLFIPRGTVCRWNIPRYLRKYYATLKPEIRPKG